MEQNAIETPQLQQEASQLQQQTPLLQQETPSLQYKTPQIQQEVPQIKQEVPQIQQETSQIQQETPEALAQQSINQISSYENISLSSGKQLSQSGTPIDPKRQFISDPNLSSSDANLSQSESMSELLSEQEIKNISKQQYQKKMMLLYQKMVAKINATFSETHQYIKKLTENTTEVLVIKQPIPQELQSVIHIWADRPLKRPNLLMRLSLEQLKLKQQEQKMVISLFSAYPSILLSINGKPIQNNKSIYIQNDIYYEGNEQFMIVYNQENQETYLGSFKDKKYNGEGKLINKNNKFGFKYVGNFVDGKFSGKGELKSANYCIYKGDFQNDAKHGEGVQTIFIVKKKKNQQNAKPVLVPHIVFKGQFLFGERNGKGVEECPQNYKYEGFWKGGVKCGHGTISFIKLGHQYVGNFQNNEFNGQGKHIEKDNCEYEGEFLNGKYHGKGKMTYVNGDVYEGEFEFGKKHGQGVYTWSDKDYYDGNWINDSAQGQGTSMIGADFYDGQFKNGVRHGEGTLTDGEGEVVKAIWLDGKIMRVMERNGQIVEE